MIELVELVESVESGKDLANGFSQKDSSTSTFAMVGDMIWRFGDLDFICNLLFDIWNLFEICYLMFGFYLLFVIWFFVRN